MCDCALNESPAGVDAAVHTVEVGSGTATIIGAVIAGATTLIAAEIAKDSASKYEITAYNDGNTMKHEFGNGISTIINIYNETGSNATLNTTHSWHGHIWKYPYAPSIGNGQWGVCLHIHASWSLTGSEGAMVYRVKNGEGAESDVFLGWETPYSGKNHVLVECRDKDYWWSKEKQATMKARIEKSHTTSRDMGRNGINVIGSIGQSSSPLLTFFIGLA